MPSIGRHYTWDLKGEKTFAVPGRPATAPPVWTGATTNAERVACGIANGAQKQPLSLPPGVPRQCQAPQLPQCWSPSSVGSSILRFFSRSLCVAYEAEVLHSANPSQPGVVMALWRGHFDGLGMEQLLAATLRERCAFSPPADSVTWGSVVELVEWSGCGGVETAVGATEWDVRIFRCDPCATPADCWTFATPSLTTTRERTLFLGTDVEILFQYYRSPLLYVWLAGTHAPPQLPVEVTPPDRVRGRSVAPTPAAPHKAPRRSVSEAEGADEKPPSTPEPRCLAGSFQGQATPRRQPQREWVAVAFGHQLIEWQRLQQRLRAQLEGKAAPAAYEVLRKEMRRWARLPPQDLNGVWMLSLQEYACDAMLAAAGYAAARVDTAAAPAGASAVRASLVACNRGAQRTLDVLGKINVMARRKEAAQPHGSFPFALQRVLLLALELRVLRHLSLVVSATNDVPKLAYFADAADAAACAFLGAVRELGALGPHWSPLASTLLVGGLSMLEAACYLAVSACVRCRLVESAIDTFSLWRSITRDARSAPLCIRELLDVVVEQCTATDSTTLQRTEAIRQRVEHLDRLPPADVTAFDDGDEKEMVATYLGLRSDQCPPCVGYCLRQIWSMAALDQLYQHGVRQMARLQNVLR